MKHLPLILLFFSLLYFSSSSAETLAEKHAAIESGDSIVIGSFKGFGADLKDHAISKIGIERTYCYGTCPAYLLTISNEGDVHYEGFGYVEKQGVHKGKINTDYLSDLFEYIEKSNFYDLRDTYRASVTDMPTVYTLVVKNGEEKIVKNYANAAPIDLWSIEQHIDSLLPKIQWNQKND